MPRFIRKGGGVAIYVKEDIPFKFREDLSIFHEGLKINMYLIKRPLQMNFVGTSVMLIKPMHRQSRLQTSLRPRTCQNVFQGRYFSTQ